MKVIRHDFGAIHDALNKMVIAEVKAALELLPEKMIKSDGDVPLCHIVVSGAEGYRPDDVSVTKVTMDAAGELHIFGVSRQHGGCLYDEDDTDWLDITDFSYLIDKIAERLDGDKTVNLVNKSFMVLGYSAEASLRNAAERLVTV